MLLLVLLLLLLEVAVVVCVIRIVVFVVNNTRTALVVRYNKAKVPKALALTAVARCAVTRHRAVCVCVRTRVALTHE